MPFVKGKSGNPKGVPRKQLQIKELLLPLVPKAVEVISAALDSDDPKAQITAAKDVFDRVFGKSMEHVEVTGKDGGPLVAVIKDG